MLLLQPGPTEKKLNLLLHLLYTLISLARKKENTIRSLLSHHILRVKETRNKVRQKKAKGDLSVRVTVNTRVNKNLLLIKMMMMIKTMLMMEKNLWMRSLTYLLRMK